MIIITVFICLIAERFVETRHTLHSFKWRKFAWFRLYTNFILTYFSSSQFHFHRGKISVLFIVLPPAIFIQAIDTQLAQTFLPLEFLFSIGVLLYCFGPQPFYGKYKTLCNSEASSDSACSEECAEQLLNRPLTPNEKKHFPHTITLSLFSVFNDRVLAPIFWFVLIGPLGAILFRCSSQLYFATLKAGDGQNEQNRYKHIAYSAGFLYAILNWIPSRLSAFGLAAMGDFPAAMRHPPQIKAVLFQISQQGNEQLLQSIGGRAINLPDAPDQVTTDKMSEALAILRRNTQLWMGTIAVLTLVGWIH